MFFESHDLFTNKQEESRTKPKFDKKPNVNFTLFMLLFVLCCSRCLCLCLCLCLFRFCCIAEVDPIKSLGMRESPLLQTQGFKSPSLCCVVCYILCVVICLQFHSIPHHSFIGWVLRQVKLPKIIVCRCEWSTVLIFSGYFPSSITSSLIWLSKQITTTEVAILLA